MEEILHSMYTHAYIQLCVHMCELFVSKRNVGRVTRALTRNMATQARPMLSNEIVPWNGLLPWPLHSVQQQFQLTQVSLLMYVTLLFGTAVLLHTKFPELRETPIRSITGQLIGIDFIQTNVVIYICDKLRILYFNSGNVDIINFSILN